MFIKLTVCFGVCLSRKSINESKNVSGMAAEVMGRFNVFCDLGICHDFFFFFLVHLHRRNLLRHLISIVFLIDFFISRLHV